MVFQSFEFLGLRDNRNPVGHCMTENLRATVFLPLALGV